MSSGRRFGSMILLKSRRETSTTPSWKTTGNASQCFTPLMSHSRNPTVMANCIFPESSEIVLDPATAGGGSALVMGDGSSPTAAFRTDGETVVGGPAAIGAGAPAVDAA